MRIAYMLCEMDKHGFTLMELLIVIIIIAVSAGLAAPAIGTAMAERRVAQAALDLVRIGRQARSEALGYGRAHVLRFTNSSSVGVLGRVRVFRGINNGCNTNDWVTIMAAASMQIEDFDMSDQQYQVGSHSIQLRAPNDPLDVCFEGSGVVRYRSGATATGNGRFTDANTVGGGFVVTLQRQVDGTSAGVVRRVILPLGGQPRVLR